MITKEEIELARNYTAYLTEEDSALLLVSKSAKGDMRILLAGEDKSTDRLLQDLSCWCEQMRSERRNQR